MRVELWQTLLDSGDPIGDVLLRIFQEGAPLAAAHSAPQSPAREAHNHVGTTSAPPPTTPARPPPPTTAPTPATAHGAVPAASSSSRPLLLVIASAEGLPQGEFVAVVTMGNGQRLQTVPRPTAQETVWDQSFLVCPHPDEVFDFSVVAAWNGAVVGTFDLRGGDLMLDPGCDWQLPLKDAAGEVRCMLAVRMEEAPAEVRRPPPNGPAAPALPR
eukprot:EG_transcript_30737